jgi:hypothetical protein
MTAWAIRKANVRCRILPPQSCLRRDDGEGRLRQERMGLRVKSPIDASRNFEAHRANTNEPD